MSTSLFLSDDEIVAVATLLGHEWMGTLPTVDTEHASSLLASSARGHRSLFLRGLLALADGRVRLAPELEELLSPAVGAVPAVIGYAAGDGALETVAGASFSVFRNGDDARIVVLALPNGINEVRRLDPASAADFVRNFADGIRRPPRRPRRATAVVLLAPSTREAGGFGVVTSTRITIGFFDGAAPDLTAGSLVDRVPDHLVAGGRA